MSRIANKPIEIPTGVEVNLKADQISVKGSNGQLEMTLHKDIEINQEGNILTFIARGKGKTAHAMSGTTRALVSNMIAGVTKGFEKKLELVGVGYRAQLKGKSLGLTLGFSHPIDYDIPDGVVVEVPSQTEILIKGADKQKVGQVAADIRAYRPPEPYKGKGVRYSDEQIVIKEAKKK